MCQTKMPIGKKSQFDRIPFVTSARTSLTLPANLPPAVRNPTDEARLVFLSYPSDVLLEWRWRPRHRIGMDLSTRLLRRRPRERRLPGNSEHQCERRP